MSRIPSQPPAIAPQSLATQSLATPPARSAFFRAALEAAPTVRSADPVVVETRTVEPAARTEPSDQAGRAGLRPGSLLDIRV
jgi:hypothetical protein